jgi:hypothetical protein
MPTAKPFTGCRTAPDGAQPHTATNLTSVWNLCHSVFRSRMPGSFPPITGDSHVHLE